MNNNNWEELQLTQNENGYHMEMENSEKGKWPLKFLLTSYLDATV